MMAANQLQTKIRKINQFFLTSMKNAMRSSKDETEKTVQPRESDCAYRPATMQLQGKVNIGQVNKNQQ